MKSGVPLSKQENSKWQGFNYDDYSFTPKEQLQAILEGILILLGISYLFYESLLICLASVFLLPFYLKLRKEGYKKHQKQELSGQFKECIQALSATLRVGYSIENGWKEVYKDMRMLLGKNALMTKEIGYMISQMELNVPLEQLLIDFGKRSGLEDVKSFTSVFVTAKRSGGDFIQIIDHTVKAIGEKMEVKAEIETLLAAKRLEHRVMCLIPFGIIFYMKFSFPGFTKVLYGNIFGVIVMTVCLAIYLGAFYLGNKMVEVEV